MNTRIKICGITRLEDALLAAQLGAHALGFVFYPSSPRALSPEQAREMIAALPPFVVSVGLFVNATPEAVRATLEVAPVNLLQFHGDESAAYCEQFGLPYLRAIRIKSDTDLLQYATEFRGAKALLLDTWVDGVPGGTGEQFDWGLIPHNLPLPIILSGGLNAQIVTKAVQLVRPWAVDVSSGVERSKGIKDPIKMANFIQGVRDACL